MRLIDKDDIFGMVKAMTFDYDICADCDTRTDKQKAEDWFEMAKTIFASLLELEHEIDAVPVVRCKDCVHRKEDSGGDWCECTGCDVNPNGFCEEGSRDENQNN